MDTQLVPIKCSIQKQKVTLTKNVGVDDEGMETVSESNNITNNYNVVSNSKSEY